MKTTIQVSENTRDWLAKLKYNLGAADYDEVLQKIKKLIIKFKLTIELKDIK